MVIHGEHAAGAARTDCQSVLHMPTPGDGLRHSKQVRLLAIFLLASCGHAAVVEGVVLDEETGFPLARTQVALYPLPGTQADVTPVNTGARGSFVIESVRPGWYVLRATRRGYVTAEFGQSRADAPGTHLGWPIAIHRVLLS